MDTKTPLSGSTILIVALLSIITGAYFGFASGNFGIGGWSTFFISALIAYVIYALIARVLTKRS